MQTLAQFWSAWWPTLTLAALFAACLAACLWRTLLYECQTDPERMSALDGGGDAQPSTPNRFAPTPDLIASQCAQCRSIRCVDRRWLPEAMVPLPVGCRVSHGLCPACERTAHAEIERCLPVRSRNLQVALPTALPAAG